MVFLLYCFCTAVAVKGGVAVDIVSDDKKYVSVGVAAGVTGFKPATIRAWCRDHKLKAYKLGNSIRILLTDLRQFVQQREM